MTENKPPLFLSANVWTRWLTLAWFVILILGVLSNPMIDSPGRDSGIFLYIGSQVLKGKIPYLDVWENKGPLVYYINALGLFISKGSRWGIWLMELIVFLIAAWIFYGIIKRTMGPLPALGGTFVWIWATGNVLQGGNFSEEYSLFFFAVAVLCYMKSLEAPHQSVFGFIIGASLGFNILLRPNNVAIQASIAAVYLLLSFQNGEWWLLINRWIRIGLGTVLVVMPGVFYFALRGALDEMVDIVLKFNYQYSSGYDIRRMIDGIGSASLAIGISWIIPGVIGYGLALHALIRRVIMRSILGKLLLLLVIGWSLEAVLSTLSGRNYPHYFILWTPYLGFMCSYLLYIVVKPYQPWLERYTLPVLISFVVLAFACRIDAFGKYGLVLVTWWSYPGTEIDYVHPVAHYIQENTMPGEKVLVWGFRPAINFMSGRDSPVSFLPYPLIHVDTSLGHFWAEQFFAQFTGDPPALIIDMVEPADRERIPVLDPLIRKTQKIKWKSVVLAPNLNDTLDFIKSNYELVDIVDGYDIYRLKVELP
ncbi:MAG: hypothetical protein FJZ87_17210 [Chloroflexi bacterium]|nr:hypothetical protein [Chloroflexota bacterium]